MSQGRQPLRFELPYSAPAPKLISPDLGLHKMARLGASSYAMDVTVLDTPDNRLLRAGVVLAHRISDGIGQWYLAAPEWPTLPPEQIEPVGAAAELPHQFARWILPLTRGVLVGPVAGLSTDRTEYGLRNAENRTLAHIRDDLATVRRGGLIVARFREVSVKESEALSDEQWEWIIDSMTAAAATRMDEFPRIQERIGAPATGLSDFPSPEPLRKDMTLDRYARRLFSLSLNEIVAASLALLSGVGTTRRLVKALHRTATIVNGLSSVLEPKWRETLESQLAALADVDPDQPELRLHTAELQGVINALVSAARAPRLGDLSGSQAHEVFTRRARAGTVILFDRCRHLTPDSPLAAWVATQRAADQLRSAVLVAADLRPKVAKPFQKYLKRLSKQLRGCIVEVAEPTPDELSGLTPESAYDLGRRVAERQFEVRQARERFVANWESDVARMRKLVAER